MSRTYETRIGTVTIYDGQEDADEAPHGQPSRMAMTPDEAAQALGLRRSTLDDYARRGIVPSVKVGRHRRFLPDELQRFLDAL